MPSREDPGLSITPTRLSFWLALISLAAILYGGVTAWNNQGFAIDTLKANDASMSQTIEKLNANVEKLDGAVRDLTLQMARTNK